MSIILFCLGLVFVNSVQSEIEFECLSLCPSHIISDSHIVSLQVPFSNYRILFGEYNQETCSSICLKDGWLPYLIKSEAQLGKNEEQIKWMSIPDTKDFSIVFANHNYLESFDTEFSQFERQIIKPFQRSSAVDGQIDNSDTDFLKINHIENSLKNEVIAKIKEDEYLREIRKLSGESPFTVGGKQYLIKSRNTYNVEHTYAANYIAQYLRNTNLDQVFFQPFQYSGQSTQNIIGVKKGASKPNEIVVIGAHMDSTSPDRSNAPGCIDNGSGADAVMLTALAFANVTTDRTIHFILFGAEEQGLIGSNYYVSQLRNNGYNVVYALIMDMIGYSSRYYGVKLETSNSAANKNLLDKVESNLKVFTPKLTFIRSYNYFGSDHVPFINYGIPCFLAIEQDDTAYPGYHKTTDKVNYLNVNQSVDITKAMTATLFDLVFQ